MSMIAAVAAHRAAWQAFQDAPAAEDDPATVDAACAEADALEALLSTVPATLAELGALRAHLDWWVSEEAQRRDLEPQPFMLHAVLQLSAQRRQA